MGSQLEMMEKQLIWGSRGSKDLMLSVGSEPGKVVALPQLRLGWRREERSYLGHGGRGGKDHYERGGGAQLLFHSWGKQPRRMIITSYQFLTPYVGRSLHHPSKFLVLSPG